MTNRELFTLLGEPMTEATETLFKTLDKEPEVALRFACDCAEHALQRERDADREPHEALWEAIAIARDQPFTRAARKASRAAWAVADAAGDAAEGAMTVPTTATWGGVPVEAWRVSTIANQAAIWDAGRSAALAATSASLATRRRVHTAKRTTRIAWTAKQAADAARRNAAERATNRALIAAATEIVAKSAAPGTRPPGT